MANHNNYFLLSGFIAISLFSFVLLLFVLMMFKPSKVTSYGLEKKNYVSISLDTPKVSQVKTKVNKTVSKPAQNIDVNNLFSDVWTKKIVHKEVKPKDNRRILDIQKKIITSQDNEISSISDKVNNLDKLKEKEDSKASSSAQEVNEYLAKIQAIVYQHFRVPSNSEGSSVKSVIELNALGKVIDFRVLTYSANEALNAEADRIKNRLLHVVFPKNPSKKSSRTVVILISKE
ncbi:MAG: TonB C-terminal domain-containing protein [Campylobacterota bacterium]|nr:TonB C-terminal domain-containing protein [Campylobacterota bacterium]